MGNHIQTNVKPSYLVIFKGEIRTGFFAKQVKQNIAKLTKKPLVQVEKMFSGKLMVLKAGVDELTAQVYQQKFAKAGAQCHILRQVPEAEFAPSPPPSVTQKPSPPERLKKATASKIVWLGRGLRFAFRTAMVVIAVVGIASVLLPKPQPIPSQFWFQITGGESLALAPQMLLDDKLSGYLIASGEQRDHVNIWRVDVSEALSLGLKVRQLNRGLPLSIPEQGITLPLANPDTQPKIRAREQLIQSGQDYLTTFAFNSDGRLLAVGSRDGTIQLFEINASQIAVPAKLGDIFEPGADAITVKNTWTVQPNLQQLAFEPQGNLLAILSSNRLQLWNFQTVQLVWEFNLQGRVEAFALSPDGMMAVAGTFLSDDTEGTPQNSIHLWNLRTQQRQRTLPGHHLPVTVLAYSPDGRWLASGSADNTVKLWDTTQGNLKQTLTSHQDTVTALAFRPDSLLLASGSMDKTIALWEVRNGGLIRTLTQPELAEIQTLSFTPDGYFLLSSHQGDREIAFWGGQPEFIMHMYYLNMLIKLGHLCDPQRNCIYGGWWQPWYDFEW